MRSIPTPAILLSTANSVSAAKAPFWQSSHAADKIGRLLQGHGEQKGTNAMFFIKVTDIPKGRDATYLRVVAAL
jgi:hypothetical protein